MGLQLVVRASSEAAVLSALSEFGDVVEIFPVVGIGFGISIPSKALDGDAIEARARSALERFAVFDLYAGSWSDA
jgi:hypothetical protein